MEALLSAEAWLRAHLALQPCSAQPAPTPWGYQAGSPPRKAERMCGHLTSYPAPPQPGCVSSASVGTSLSLSFLLSQPLRGLGQEAWKGCLNASVHCHPGARDRHLAKGSPCSIPTLEEGHCLPEDQPQGQGWGPGP